MSIIFVTFNGRPITALQLTAYGQRLRTRTRTIMSFEGRYQVICSNHHYNEIDVYAFSSSRFKCENCESTTMLYKNLVDDTNGQAEGMIEFDLEPEKQCPTCGAVQIYKVKNFEEFFASLFKH